MLKQTQLASQNSLRTSKATLSDSLKSPSPHSLLKLVHKQTLLDDF